MSQKNVEEFFKKVEANENLREQYKALLKDLSQSDEESAMKEVIEFAAVNGYAFTVEEMKLVGEDMQSGELSDDQLEAVAGGGSWGWVFSLIGTGEGGSFYCFFVGGYLDADDMLL